MSDSAVNGDRKFTSIHAMLHPQSIAVLGATERLQYGGRFVKNLLSTGCQAKIYPINPKWEIVFGLPCYPSIREVPEPVDLAAIIIPGPMVVDALHECAEMGAKAALVISAGFAELGTEEGRARQAELQAIARKTGLRVCGPNCLGVANVVDNLWATAASSIPIETQALKSNIGLVSQSGATCFGPLLTTARDRGVGFRYVVSTGNGADLESSDYVQYMLRDPEVSVVAALVEGFQDGDKFIETAEMALQMGKPLVLLKVGRSEVGSRAAGSHTAAMTGSDVVQDALFRQKDVVRVDDYDELIETANMFLKAKPPKGARVGVVSHSGGIGSLLADKMGEVGLEMPLLSEKTSKGLGAILGERGSPANPADVTGFASNDAFPSILELLLADDSIDIQVVASAGKGAQTQTILRAVAEQDKPILYLWTGSFKATEGLSDLQAGNVPVFYLPGRCAKGVRRLADYYRTREAILAEEGADRLLGAPASRRPGSGGERPSLQSGPPPDELPSLERKAMEALLALLSRAGSRPLSEHDSKTALSLFGVPTTKEAVCATTEEAVRAAEAIGYPVALKVASQQIAHKTEAGGVRLGITNAAELAAAREEMLATVSSRCPQADIDGVLVQQMVRGGVEVIVGVSRDRQFGPVLMVGMGGIMTEALGAAAWRVCPVTKRDALEMIEDVKGLAKILAGYRGLPKADVPALADTLVRISHLAFWAKEEISSLDVNPLAVLPDGQGVVALDALVVPA